MMKVVLSLALTVLCIFAGPTYAWSLYVNNNLGPDWVLKQVSQSKDCTDGASISLKEGANNYPIVMKCKYGEIIYQITRGGFSYGELRVYRNLADLIFTDEERGSVKCIGTNFKCSGHGYNQVTFSP